MKHIKTLLAGWIVFLVSHAGIVAIRARVLAAHMEHFQPGKPAPISNATFYTIDAALLAVAAILIILGTVGILNKPRRKLLLAVPLLAVQLFLAYFLFIWICFVVHIGVGGPL